MSRLLTPNETREKLGRCSLAQVYAHSSRGTLPKYKLGGRLFFRESDIEAYVESCRIEARKPIDV